MVYPLVSKEHRENLLIVSKRKSLKTTGTQGVKTLPLNFQEQRSSKRIRHQEKIVVRRRQQG